MPEVITRQEAFVSLSKRRSQRRLQGSGWCGFRNHSLQSADDTCRQTSSSAGWDTRGWHQKPARGQPVAHVLRTGMGTPSPPGPEAPRHGAVERSGVRAQMLLWEVAPWESILVMFTMCSLQRLVGNNVGTKSHSKDYTGDGSPGCSEEPGPGCLSCRCQAYWKRPSPCESPI